LARIACQDFPSCFTFNSGFLPFMRFTSLHSTEKRIRGGNGKTQTHKHSRKPNNSNKLYTVIEKKTRENYTRVTNVLYPFSGLEHINADVVAHAAERGSKVHKICEGIIQGLGELGVDDETRGYVESFKKWWEKGHEVLMMEKRFWDDELQITGQVDLILRTPDGLAIVDLKTSSRPSATWPAQGSAYAYLAKKAGHDIQKIFFLHLNKAGREAKLYEYPVDDSFFLAILRVWAHFFGGK
jgi:hypothetical protein